eukprot:jgi/Mesen1/2638/ME000166S01760
MNDVGVVQRSAFQTAHSDVDGHGSSLPLESLIRPQAQEIVNRVPGWSTMKFASDQGTPSDIASPSGRNIRGRADDYSTSALQKDLGMKMEKSAFKGRAWGETASGRTDAANLMADRLAEEVSGAAYHFKDKAAGAAAVAAAAAGPILSDLVSSASMKAWQQRERLSLHIVIEDYDYDHGDAVTIGDDMFHRDSVSVRDTSVSMGSCVSSIPITSFSPIVGISRRSEPASSAAGQRKLSQVQQQRPSKKALSQTAPTSKLTSVLRQQYCKKVLQSFESWHTSSVC